MTDQFTVAAAVTLTCRSLLAVRQLTTIIIVPPFAVPRLLLEELFPFRASMEKKLVAAPR